MTTSVSNYEMYNHLKIEYEILLYSFLLRFKPIISFRVFFDLFNFRFC